MRRLVRPTVSSRAGLLVALLLVAVLLAVGAAFWLREPPDQALSARSHALPREPDASPRAPGRARPTPPRALVSPRVGKELLTDPQPTGQPELTLPGALPALDAAIAPALPDADPPIEDLKVEGQLGPWAAREGARAAWPVVHGCVGQWQGALHLEFGLAGGEIVGSSRFWDPRATGAPPQVAECIVRGLADLRVAAPTDASGVAEVTYRVGSR